VWAGQNSRPLALIGGGSGLVPLMAMLRHHRAIGSSVEALLLVSTRTREAPPGWTGFTGRIDRTMLAAVGPEPAHRPAVYVCGPTPFVEAAARLLVELGHDPADVHTERFGPTGG
jgi:ferredoxin-NADP reductase